MALKNFSQFTPQTVLSATDFVVGYRSTDEIRTDLDSLTDAISGILISKGFTPGGALGTVKRVNYRYTIDLGENLNAVSGADDYGLFLTYTPNQLDVYRNGVHLVDGQDYLANNTTQVTNLSTMNTGDVIDIVTLSAAGFTIALSGSGSIFTNHYRYTVPVNSVTLGSVNVVGPDDLGNTLQYSSPNLEVYLNGSHLVYGLDYTALNGVNITMVDGLSTGDVVDVSVISAYDIGGMATLSTGVFKLRPGPGIILNPANGVGDVTITGNTLQLTGGNIIIPVGSTRNFQTIQSAFNSLSGLLLDSTAVVTISCDPETFNTTSTTDISHPNGDKITLAGTTQEFRCLNNPVISVSGGFTYANRVTGWNPLSATLAFNPSFNIPAVNDFVYIQSVSGRDATIYAGGQYMHTDNNCNIRFRWPGYPGYSLDTQDHLNYAGLLFCPFPLSGARAIISVLSAGTTSHLVRTVAALSGTTGSGDTISPAIVWSEPRVASFANLGPGNTKPNNFPIVTIGTPDSYRGTTFTQIPSSYSVLSTLRTPDNLPVLPFDVTIPAVLTFSDATATNTYLNPGDWIYASGQCRQVIAVSANNRCIIDRPFYEGTASGRTSTINTATPFLIKTHFERYAGLHRVAAVAGSNVTIQAYKAFHAETFYSSIAEAVPSFEAPLPIHGVAALANPNIMSTADGAPFGLGKSGKIYKSILMYNSTPGPDSAAALKLQDTTIAEVRNLLIRGQGTTSFLIDACKDVTINDCAFTGDYAYGIRNIDSEINLRYCAFTALSSRGNAAPGPNPDGTGARSTFGIFADNSIIATGSVNYCSFRGYAYPALSYYLKYNYSTFTDSLHLFVGTQIQGTIYYSYLYLYGLNGGGGNGTAVGAVGFLIGIRSWSPRTALHTYNLVTYYGGYYNHVFSHSGLNFQIVEGDVAGNVVSGSRGMTLADSAGANFAYNYSIGNVDAGIYFYQSNAGSDVGYLASWCFALNDLAFNSGGSNVVWNNRTGGGILNNRVVVYMSSGNTSQKINAQQYYKAGNGLASEGGVVDGAAVSANDNLVRVV